MNKTFFNRGDSQLLLVLVVAMILSLLTFTMLSISYLQTKQASQLSYSKESYFASEGSLYETVQHIKNDPLWPSPLPFNDSYQIGKTNITRNIIDSAGTLMITVDADTFGAKRRLLGEFQRHTTSAETLDIIIIVDNSQSMDMKDASNVDSMTYARDAAATFVDIIANKNPSSRIGLVTFSNSASLLSPLTQDFGGLKTIINNLGVVSGTNTAAGVKMARTELDNTARSNAIKVIVLLSDGVAQWSTSSDPLCVPCANGGECTLDPLPIGKCVSNACVRPGSGYAPDNQGDCCSQDAIVQADIAKNQSLPPATTPRDYKIFSIALTSNYTFSYCGGTTDKSKSILLGKLTMLRISSEPLTSTLPPPGGALTYYFEATQGSYLDSIFTGLANSISLPGYFHYHELEPQPDSPP
jgi:hypothetical protein